MTDADRDWLGPVREISTRCIVPDDPGEVVRGAQPLDDHARAQMREQAIARMRRDEQAVAARERRIAIERAPAGRVMLWRAR